MKRFIKLKAMVVAEVLFALIVCGIILTLSVQLFKSRDISVTPHLYATIRNISQANDMIIRACENNGVCENAGSLPGDVHTYCQYLSDYFMTSGKVYCTDNDTTSETFSANNISANKNFTMSNGVSVAGLVDDDWSDDDDGTISHIDIYVKVENPRKNYVAFGENFFPLRIFINGDVIPSIGGGNAAVDREGAATNNFYEDAYFFAYNGIINEAFDPNNLQNNVRKTSSIPGVQKVSFREALCMTNPDGISRYFANENCTGIIRAQDCTPNNADRSAFCTIEPVKPTGTGLFKVFGLQ